MPPAMALCSSKAPLGPSSWKVPGADIAKCQMDGTKQVLTMNGPRLVADNYDAVHTKPPDE